MTSSNEGWQWDNRLRRDVYPVDKDEIGQKLPLDSGQSRDNRGLHFGIA